MALSAREKTIVFDVAGTHAAVFVKIIEVDVELEVDVILGTLENAGVDGLVAGSELEGHAVVGLGVAGGLVKRGKTRVGSVRFMNEADLVQTVCLLLVGVVFERDGEGVFPAVFVDVRKRDPAALEVGEIADITRHEIPEIQPVVGKGINLGRIVVIVVIVVLDEGRLIVHLRGRRGGDQVLVIEHTREDRGCDTCQHYGADHAGDGDERRLVGVRRSLHKTRCALNGLQWALRRDRSGIGRLRLRSGRHLKRRAAFGTEFSIGLKAAFRTFHKQTPFGLYQCKYYIIMIIQFSAIVKRGLQSVGKKGIL